MQSKLISQHEHTIKAAPMRLTKPFPNSFGRDVQLTRDAFIQRWIEPTHQFAYILGSEGSLDKLNELQAEIIRLAGIRWDNA